MTDAELSKAVADACGIEVFLRVLGVARHEWRRYTGEGTASVLFDPANDHNDAFYAADKAELFTTHQASLDFANGKWIVSYYSDAATKHIDGASHESGPRAICEAIIQIAKGKGAA